jgi:uncharacterized membrane protein YkgB
MSSTTASTTQPNSSRIARYGRVEEHVRDIVQQYGIAVLRIAIGIVFIWFGALKIVDQSPVLALIQTAYPFMPEPLFLHGLGYVEIVIGAGLVSGVALRATLVLFLGQMCGTLTALALAPRLFFAHGNPLLLTSEGEFVAKNIVFITAGLLIAGYALKPIDEKRLVRRGLIAMIAGLL